MLDKIYNVAACIAQTGGRDGEPVTYQVRIETQGVPDNYASFNQLGEAGVRSTSSTLSRTRE